MFEALSFWIKSKRRLPSDSEGALLISEVLDLESLAVTSISMDSNGIDSESTSWREIFILEEGLYVKLDFLYKSVLKI